MLKSSPEHLKFDLFLRWNQKRLPDGITDEAKKCDERGRDALRFAQIDKIAGLHQQVTKNVGRGLSVLEARGPGLLRRLH